MAEAQVPAAVAASSIARRAGPINGAYCIVSANDGAKGVTITAYDSEACIEKQLQLSFSDATSRVGKPVSADMDSADKRAAYQALLSHVVFDAGPNGSHKLSLTEAAEVPETPSVSRTPRTEMKGDYDTVDDILFNHPGEDSTDLTASQLMTPKTPGFPDGGFGAGPAPSPITNPHKQRGHSERKKRPKTSGSGGMRGSKSQPNFSATQPLPQIKTPNSGGRRRPQTSHSRKTKTREIAGYRPPTDLSQLDEDVLEQAKSLKGDDKKLKKMLRDEVFCLAAKRVGVDVKELRPRTTMSFKTGPTPMAKLKLMHEHYDSRRVLNMALVLMEMQKAESFLAKRDKTNEDYVKTVSSGFFETLAGERKRIAKIRIDRRKIEVVAEAENDIILKRREDFNKRMEKAEQRRQQLEEMKEQQKAYLARRSAKRQEEILRVQVQKEERERARLESIAAASQARNDNLERHRAEQLQARLDKERRMAEREEQRQRKREDVKQSKTLRRQMLLKHIDEKAHASLKIKAQREEEIARRRAERWMVAQSRQENAERVRREKEFHQKQTMEKIHNAYKMMDHMKELRAAVVEERKKIKRDMIIEVDRWKDSITLQRNIEPGPGEYESHTKLPGPTGGTWGKYAPKSDLEWQIYRASQLPGPGQYEDVDLNKMVTGGTWGKYAPKTDVEWQIYRASQIPGPGEYEPAAVPTGAAVTFGEFDPKSDLDILIANAAQMPGPSDYAPKMPPIRKPTIKSLKKKLRQAADKVKMANTFISMAKKAATTRRNSYVAGIKSKPAVSQKEVAQTQHMLNAFDAKSKAEQAAAEGDEEEAARQADKAALSAVAAARPAMGTGAQVGMSTGEGSDVAVKSAVGAAKAARRASMDASANKAAMEAAAKAAAQEESKA